ncbi:methyltransferase domain-containing protein [Synechococcus sp. GreenBA-s]|nr:methyltransferase domain-containing protein [Synechococcus sp. GreenBA-s]
MAQPPSPLRLLSDEQRRKLDEGDDALFYAQPRFVQHLDGAFRSRLTRLYRERLQPGTVVLDLMSSWVSHLPDDVAYGEVIGHGLNAEELAANPRLDRHWVQNLNRDTQLPLADRSVDAALIVAGWQYLQQPEAVAAELRRVLRPEGQLIVTFSNRMFSSKAPRIWLEGSDRDHLAYVARVLLGQGWRVEPLVAEGTRAEGPLGWIGGQGDPFFAVVARP